MIGEMLQDMKDEAFGTDPNSPADTVLTFIGTGATLALMGEALEAAGQMGTGMAMGTSEQTQALNNTLDNTLNNTVTMQGPSLTGGMV